MRTLPDFHSTLANPPFVADHAGLYRTVAESIARQPDHLVELVRLMVALRRAGVRVSDHADCLFDALILEGEE